MSVLLFDVHRFVDRDVGEVFGVSPSAVCPHDADASIRGVVDSVYRARVAVAKALVDDARIVLY